MTLTASWKAFKLHSRKVKKAQKTEGADIVMELAW